MDIVVLEELKAYIDPLTNDEYEALERSLLAEGCRDSLVLWGDILVDGHNRYGICQKHGIPFNTVQNTRFQSMEDVHLWMIEQHLGRRSVSDYQRGVLALRKREILARRLQAQREADLEALRAAQAATAAAEAAEAEAAEAAAALKAKPESDDLPPWDPVPVSRAELAREAKLSANQVAMIERIHTQAAPEVVEALKAGEISISAAAAVASLPVEEQRSAAQGGKAELKQAAKRAREAKKRPRTESAGEGANAEGGETGEGAESATDVRALQRRITRLERENEELRSKVATLQNQLVRMREAHAQSAG
ncbi:plasmid replication/partition related protein [Pseudoxanthomonas suwonensis]|uniref:plasmid replication/partition related protein n=1 Tax=Pseudoxanthomonas suwonensis TaxID=314722 RepID=UPI00138F6D37|nr:plasmid replication/partition related protein [Pseudoxanthomonas suwonensis]KAF1701672.1 plasmid replication/partition related protein [Pseudoxanthomonas suwonensis]